MVIRSNPTRCRSPSLPIADGAGLPGTLLCQPNNRHMKTRVRHAIRFCWILAFFLSITGWAIFVIFETSEVDAHGVLHEPLFPLIPISSFLLLLAIVLAVIDLAAEAWSSTES